MKIVFAFAVLLLTACASTAPPDSPPPAAAAVGDERIAELQTSVTELLERLDVMSSRIARLEEERAAPVQASPPVRIQAPAAAATSVQPDAAAREERVPQQQAVAGAEIAERYRQGVILMSSKKYAQARPIFERVLEDDPTGSLADNALFWLGETYYATGDYATAIRYYSRVTIEYSDQNKAPDALLKTALSLEKTGDLALARTTLQQVIERYPYSTPAAAAKKELDRIRY